MGELKAALVLPYTCLDLVMVQAALDQSDEFVALHEAGERVVLRVAELGLAVPVAVEGGGGVFMPGLLQVAEDEVVDMVGRERARSHD